MASIGIWRRFWGLRGWIKWPAIVLAVSLPGVLFAGGVLVYDEWKCVDNSFMSNSNTTPECHGSTLRFWEDHADHPTSASHARPGQCEEAISLRESIVRTGRYDSETNPDGIEDDGLKLYNIDGKFGDCPGLKSGQDATPAPSPD